MLNPINHTLTPEGVSKYLAEPYVVAADVYSRPPHNGRCGWTWYTGSAGWMYRVGVESLLGLTLKGGALHVDPCIPSHWSGYTAVLTTPHAAFHIVIDNPDGVNRGVRTIDVDGVTMTDTRIPIAGAVGRHDVRVILGNEERRTKNEEL